MSGVSEVDRKEWGQREACSSFAFTVAELTGHCR